MLTKITTILVIALVSEWKATPSLHADVIYSIDRLNDVLVTIDPATGAVSNVGSLQFNAVNSDLAAIDNRLFVLETQPTLRSDLYEINPLTGQTISASQVTRPGGQVRTAEGLTSVDDSLRISFSSTGTTFASNAVGVLGFDGVISSFMVFANGDFDGLGTDENGVLYAVDTFGDNVRSLFYRITESPPNATLLQTNFSNLLWSDLHVANGKALIIGQDAPRNATLFTRDMTTGSITSVAINGPGEYFSIASLESAAVPEPGSLAILVGGSILCMLRRQDSKPPCDLPPSGIFIFLESVLTRL